MPLFYAGIMRKAAKDSQPARAGFHFVQNETSGEVSPNT
jgi:hypothetical protein